MLTWIVFITAFVVAVAWLSGRFTARYAAAKGRSETGWFVAGALLFALFPLPWIVLVVLPPRNRPVAVN